MTGEQIIKQFRLQVDDSTELSSTEELQLLNDVYLQCASDRVWEILKTSATGTIVNNEITLPADFSYLFTNHNYNGNTTENTHPVIFVGSTYQPYKVVNFSERRQYRNTSGYAYLDMANNKIVFPQTPTETSYEFDYVKVPAELTLATEPVFPERFHKKFAYDMAVQDSIIQMSDRAATMAGINVAESKKYMDNMAMWNSKLQII